MPRVELQRSLSVPAVPARSAASFVMHRIAEAQGDWREFALYLDFASLGLPDVGYVAIPVRVSGVDERLEPRHEIRFKLQARRSPESFPEFDGAIGVDANGASGSLLWLAGSYEVPMRGLGGLMDRVFAHGTAEKTLENMLEELGEAIQARVEQRERAHARYRLVFDTGD